MKFGCGSSPPHHHLPQLSLRKCGHDRSSSTFDTACSNGRCQPRLTAGRRKYEYYSASRTISTTHTERGTQNGSISSLSVLHKVASKPEMAPPNEVRFQHHQHPRQFSSPKQSLTSKTHSMIPARQKSPMSARTSTPGASTPRTEKAATSSTTKCTSRSWCPRRASRKNGR